MALESRQGQCPLRELLALPVLRQMLAAELILPLQTVVAVATLTAWYEPSRRIWEEELAVKCRNALYFGAATIRCPLAVAFLEEPRVFVVVELRTEQMSEPVKEKQID